MSDIFREVDEALQREKAEKFWNEYGPTLLTAAVLLVVGTALGVAWRTWDHKRNETETAKLVSAIDANDTAQLQNVIADSRNGPEAIALFNAANALQVEGKNAEAAALYRQAAESRGTPKDLRDLSRILYVRTAVDATAEQKLAVLKPVLNRKDSPFIWQARIEAALTEAGAERYEEAAGHLSAFESAENDLPPSLMERGNTLRQLYAIKAADTQESE